MRAWIPVLGVAALLVSGCSNDDAAPLASPTPTPDLSAQLQDWASGVCESSDALADQVADIAGGLDVNLEDGLDQLPEIQDQVTANIDDIETGIDGVQAALSSAPAESAPAQTFATEMDALIADARSSGQETVELLNEAIEAGNFLSAGLAATAAFAAAQSAYDDASAALDLLDRTRTQEAGELGEAFAAAEGCR